MDVFCCNGLVFNPSRRCLFKTIILTVLSSLVYDSDLAYFA
jgi:hypothetical protein